MKGNRIITIGRQIGSGGSEIGMEVAKRLGIQCYDRQLIEMACDYGSGYSCGSGGEAAESISLLCAASDAE